MSDEHGITAKNIMATLPPVLATDDNTEALAYSTAQILEMRLGEIRTLRLYSRIDELPEELLDILAYDFKVDWWSADYSLEEKRRTLKESWYVHRILGTKAAIERAISAIYPETTVEEWFEYGGEPYHFRLWINLTDDDVDSERMRRVLDRLNYYKNLRSHNDGIRYFTDLDATPQVTANVMYTGCFSRVDVEIPSEAPPVPSYPVKTGAGLAVKAMEINLSREIDAHTEVPNYRAHTSAGIAVGTICMSMEVNIR